MPVCHSIHAVTFGLVQSPPSGTLDQNRRMSKDYEESAETGKAFVLVAMSCLIARRLVRS